MSNTTALTSRKASLDRVRSLLEKSQVAFARVAGKYLTPERLIKVGLAAFSRQPELLDCSPQSILLAFMQAAEVGLEPGSARKEAYLIPFRNKHSGKLEALFLPSYSGLVTIARRSGEVMDVEARCAYEKDEFDVDYGESRLVHKPYRGVERGEVIAAWSRATFKDGRRKFEVLWRDEIDKVRASSRAGDSGPWVAWYDEMARKTAVRRLCKLLPKSDDLAVALALEDDEERPETRYADVVDFASNVIEISAPEAGGSRAEALKRDIARKRVKADAPPATEVATEEAAEIRQREIDEARREAGELFGREPGSDDA